MRNDPNVIKKQAGSVTLASSKAVGNGTVTVSSAPFPLKDTLYYQVGAHGDYIQEQPSKD